MTRASERDVPNQGNARSIAKTSTAIPASAMSRSVVGTRSAAGGGAVRATVKNAIAQIDIVSLR
jgi:hypothetical protein